MAGCCRAFGYALTSNVAPFGRLAVPSLLSAALLGCGGGPPLPLLVLGPPEDRVPAAAPGVFYVEANVNGAGGAQVVLDTGAPIALLNPKAWNGAVPDGPSRVATMKLGSTTLWKVPTIGLPKDVDLAPNGKIAGGLVGFTVFGQFMLAFDYRGADVAFGPAPLPDGVATSPITVPFTLEGGGLGIAPGGGVVAFPASRVIVPATIEGESHFMLVDTGASWVGLRQSIFDGLLADGRGQVSDKATLATGPATTNVTRLRSVVVAGAEVTTALGASADAMESLLDGLGKEVGHPIDGLLGAPFLREFYTTVDYPAGTLRLSRYTTRDHIHDEYQRVGVTLKGTIYPTHATYRVDSVYPGTDAAAQKILSNDILLEVDDVALDMGDGIAADERLRGAVGSMHKLKFTDRTLMVRVDELLPLP
jgi:Aspartyl protease